METEPRLLLYPVQRDGREKTKNKENGRRTRACLKTLSLTVFARRRREGPFSNQYRKVSLSLTSPETFRSAPL